MITHVFSKLLSRSTKSLDVATQADKDYQKALEKANERQTRFYESEMPSILEVSIIDVVFIVKLMCMTCVSCFKRLKKKDSRFLRVPSRR